MITKPNLLIIGAMKSATTLLYQVLETHPKIWMPDLKEPNYFSKVCFHMDGVIRETDDHWQEYLQLFEPADAAATYIGEASTDYTKYPHIKGVPSLIRTWLGEPKMIYILRDPVNRSISQYKHSMIASPRKVVPLLRDVASKDTIIVDTSRYIVQLEEYWKVFDRSQIHITKFEDLLNQFDDEMDKIMGFLELDKGDWSPELKQANSADQLAKSVALRSKFGPLVRLRNFVPQKLVDFLMELYNPTVHEIAIFDEDKSFLSEALREDTQRLNDVLGYELYKA